MPLAPGTRLGPYEIVAAIAAGGMGEVYRARDSRLQRDVAVKVLPELFASDPARRGRFEREAQAVAALSHPNILSIFDVGVEGRTAYAVTELLDGETLRERLASGPLPLRKVVDYGAQISRGLAAAHDKGIVHRDLKPENLFLLDDGRVKILDFGIARPATTDASATMEASTDPGTVMGTAGYMAPEQVRGQTVDQRTDLFALGAVLYEMLTGRRAFQRDTPAETMTAILRDEPPEIANLGGPVPPGLDRIVRHCLEKGPAERFQSARDVAFAIEALSGTSTARTQAIEPSPRRSRRWIWPAVAAAAVMVGAPAAFIAGGRLSRPAETAANVSSEIKTFDPMFISNARFMPDGETVVFSAATAGNVPSLHISRANTATPQAIGPPSTHLLSVSSAGELAVLTNVSFLGHRLYTGTLARMTLDGAPRSWMSDVREADWAPNGSDLALVHALNSVDRLEYPADHVLYQTSGYISDPRVSPDGKRVAFFDHPGRFDDRGTLKVADADGKVTTVTKEYWGLQGLVWTSDGSTLVFSGGFGSESGYQIRMAAASGPASDRQLFPSLGSVVVLDGSKDGRYIVARLDDRLGIRVKTPAMREERELGWLNSAIAPHLSPDEKVVAFTDQSQRAGATYSATYRTVDGGPVAPLGDGSAEEFSPDGKWLLSVVPSEPKKVFAYPVGPGVAQQLDRGPIKRYTGIPGWFPDSRRVVLCGVGDEAAPRCYQQAIGGSPQPITPAGYAAASVSPDGTTVLLAAVDRTWHRLTLAGGTIEPLKMLTGGDQFAGWSSDSHAVYVQPDAPDYRVERVDLVTGERKPVRQFGGADESTMIKLFVTDYRDDGAYAYWYWKRPTTMFVVSGLQTK